MASQITHIPYGRKALEMFLADREIDEQKFLVGTVFADIRYLGTTERGKTHWSQPKISQLKKIDDDFKLGMYVHSLVDIERNKVLEKLRIYEQVSQGLMASAVLKIIEDTVTYQLVDDWGKIISYFDEVLEEELEYVSRETASEWHKKIQEYFSQPPSLESVAKFLDNLILTKKQRIEGVELFERLNNDQKVKRELGQVYSQLFASYEKD